MAGGSGRGGESAIGSGGGGVLAGGASTFTQVTWFDITSTVSVVMATGWISPDSWVTIHSTPFASGMMIRDWGPRAIAPYWVIWYE